jgi:hypothetical protein
VVDQSFPGERPINAAIPARGSQQEERNGRKAQDDEYAQHRHHDAQRVIAQQAS